MKKFQSRQGDVFVESLSSFKNSTFYKERNLNISDSKPIVNQPRIILAAGEVTGHHHAITADETQCKAYQNDNLILLDIFAPVELNHEEHGTIELPKEKLISYIQMEYDHAASRRARD
jgi:hypothetical protein